MQVPRWLLAMLGLGSAHDKNPNQLVFKTSSEYKERAEIVEGGRFPSNLENLK